MDDSSQLLIKASQGDPGAMDTLLERHLPGLYAYVRVKAGDLVRAKESISDVVQSVCREVLQEAKTFEYRGEGAFRQWLYTQALHKIIDKHRYWKAEKRDPAREVDPKLLDSQEKGFSQILGSLMTPSGDAIVREELEGIELAFRELPEHYREVIVMARFYCMSNTEIGEKLGKNKDAVRVLLGRALARLATIMRRGSGRV